MRDLESSDRSWLQDVRVVKGPLLNVYVQRRFREIGRRFESPWIAYHAWRPGLVELSEIDGQELFNALSGKATDAKLERAQSLLRERGFLDPGELNLDQLVGRIGNFAAIQNPFEMRDFLSEVAPRKPKVVVEIGTAGGGMFNCMCQVAADDALVVSIDIMGGGPMGSEEARAECELFGSFGKPKQKLEFIRGSSLSFVVRSRLVELLNGRKIDLLFIDGDHNYGAVKADFETYRDLVTDGGLIAFHDICLMPDKHGPGLEVGMFWNELRPQQKVREIIEPQGARSQEQLFTTAIRDFPWLMSSQSASAIAEAIIFGSDVVESSAKSQLAEHISSQDWTAAPRQLFLAYGIGLVYWSKSPS